MSGEVYRDYPRHEDTQEERPSGEAGGGTHQNGESGPADAQVPTSHLILS